MGSLYYPWADIASDAGLIVMVTDTNAGWEYRSRSSGGFSSPPLGVMWHHAACSQSTSDESCVNYECNGNPDAPVGNFTLGRQGEVWPVAGGASNCSGKGGPWDFSRGQCPLDSGNTNTVNVEVVNDGVGEAWSTALIDAYIAMSNAVNAYLGNQPTDVVGHAHYAPTRKIDPAVAGSVQGSWQPRSTNANGTWNLDDMKAECLGRSTGSDDIVTDDDIQKIANAVWGRILTNHIDGSQMAAGTMLEATHGDTYRTPDYVWQRTLTNLVSDTPMAAGTMLEATHADSYKATQLDG